MTARKNGWTPELDEQLKNAVENFVSVQRLSVRFNRSEGSIKSHASDLGLVLPTTQRFRERIAASRWVARKRSKVDVTT